MTSPSNGGGARELNGESIPDIALNAVESALQLLYEAQIRLGSMHPHERITPVLIEWLDPHARGDERGRAKKVEDALLIANRLDPSDIEELTPSLLPWAYSTPYRDTIVQLLGRMRFETMRNAVAPFIGETGRGGSRLSHILGLGDHAVTSGSVRRVEDHRLPRPEERIGHDPRGRGSHSH